MKTIIKNLAWCSAVLGIVLSTTVLTTRAWAQDQYQDQNNEDPPSRVARLAYMEGSVSFQPAGENDWTEAVINRPVTIGDRLWADNDSRAELQLGSAAIRLNSNTGASFLNLDDNTIQLQLTSGSVNVRVRRLDRNDVVEIDTPNLAFSVDQPGSYRIEASEDGTYTVVSLREGEGEATGNGQTYSLHSGQRATFSGTDTLNAEVQDIGGPDPFDNWSYARERRYQDSRSAQYVSRDLVGYDDLDQYGDWRDDPNYGHVWYPNQVSADWAPYREGHWDWIDPWGYTWVDDSPWGYAPFHYGRWAVIGGRWGWIAGPPTIEPVYAPALVVFIGGAPGGFGGDVGWFPLGPREVYVPSYSVSRGYFDRVNVSNTTVNTTTITNVYNTTIVNKSATITNVNYVNRSARNAVTVVPQQAFATAQPVARAAVRANPQQLASAPITARVPVAPTRQSVLGVRAATANHVKAPPVAVANRQVIAKKTPPPPRVPFAAKQQALAAHPGQPLARNEVRNLRPAAAQAHPLVKQAPPGKPATPNVRATNQGGPARPGPRTASPANRPGNPPANERPGAANPQPNRPPTPEPNRPANAQPENRPEPNRPAEPAERSNRPPAAQPNRPAERNTPTPEEQPNNRPERNQSNRPDQNRPEANRPSAERPNNPPPAQPQQRAEPNRANEPARNERPQSAQPSNRPEQASPESTREQTNRPDQNRPGARTSQEERNAPAEAKPAQREQQKQTPDEKRKEQQRQQQEKEQQRKKQEEEKPPSL